MTIMDDIETLLPDNDSEEISAADVRAAFAIVVNNGIEVEARVRALESDTGGGAGGVVSVTGRWQVNPQSGGVPGGQQVEANKADWTAATVLSFAKVTQGNTDMTAALTTADRLVGQMQTDSTNWASYTVTGDAIDQGTYVDVPVEFVNGEGSVSVAQWQSAVFVFLRDL